MNTLNIVSFLGIFSTVGLYGLFHSWTASLGVKRWVRGQFGRGADRWYRLVYNLIAGVTFLPIFALLISLPDAMLYRIPSPWLWVMIAGQLAAAIVILIGIMQTGGFSFIGLSQLVSPPEEGSDSHLYSQGMYRWVRHPLYTAGLALIWLSPEITLNSFSLYMGFTAYIIIGAYVEERKLVEEFGEAYVRYQKSTPMLIPGFPGKTPGKKTMEM